MKKAAAGMWFILVTMIFVGVSGFTITGFVGDSMSEGEHNIMNVVGNVNKTLSETQRQYTNYALSSIKISGDLRTYLDDLNKTLSHVRDRPSLDPSTPCMYRLPNPSALTEELLTIKIFESDETSSYGSGVRVQTLIGQQVKDYFNIPGLFLCSVGGTDSEGNEHAESFHNWYWKVNPCTLTDCTPGKWASVNHDTNQWTYILNSGSDKTKDYMVVDAILNGDEPYKLEVGALGEFWDTGSGDWVFSPSKGQVCIIPALDGYGAENYAHPGFHPDAIKRMFEGDFGEYVDRTNFPRHIDQGWRSGKTPTGFFGLAGGKPYDIMPVCH